jgi:glucuronokinase
LPPAAIEGRAFARAGLLGNPSDGYFGRALSVVLRDFKATVTLDESADLRIEPDPDDLDVFESLEHLSETVRRQGYYGGVRLLKATMRTFHDYCRAGGLALPSRNFTARYGSSIPRQVGLGGSSAIVTAALRAMMDFYELEIPQELQPNLVLSAELDELGITAGLQDRVVQVYEGLVYMDFSRPAMEELGHGSYESLDPALLPGMFLAHQVGPAKVSGGVLNDVRARWERGDADVHETLDGIAALAIQGRDALMRGDHELLSSLVNENFDLRRRIMPIAGGDLAMVDAARRLGASAKLAGSGGAVIGVVKTDEMMKDVVRELGALGVRVLEPMTGSTA